MKPRFQNATLTDKLIRREDFHEAYMKQVKSLVNTAPFKKNKLKIVVDVFHGAGRTYLPSLLRELGCEVEVLNDERDVYFEGRGPDPSTEGLEKLVKRVKASKAHLGLATDGDADRFGVVDSDGTIISANDILALLAQYLHQSRQWKGILAKSVMTTHAIDAIARKYVLSLRETPVGFKYIGEAMQEAESVWPEMGGEFIMGAEESGGFTMRGHVPEKDGVLACLIVAEMVASTKSSIKELIKAFHAQVGIFLSRRVNLRATPEIVRTVKEQFATKPPTQINGLNVHRIVDIDGYKFIFQGGSWLGLRFSGTEPVVRVYTEANNEKQLEVLAEAARSLLKSRTPEHVTSRKKVKVAR
ncbi:MAG: hypothetical protein ACKVQC_07055 [Elusimicrobiota bacterium]